MDFTPLINYFISKFCITMKKKMEKYKNKIKEKEIEFPFPIIE